MDSWTVVLGLAAMNIALMLPQWLVLLVRMWLSRPFRGKKFAFFSLTLFLAVTVGMIDSVTRFGPASLAEGMAASPLLSIMDWLYDYWWVAAASILMANFAVFWLVNELGLLVSLHALSLAAGSIFWACGIQGFR